MGKGNTRDKVQMMCAGVPLSAINEFEELRDRIRDERGELWLEALREFLRYQKPESLTQKLCERKLSSEYGP